MNPYRRKTYRRMVRQLRAGVPRHKVKGDRDVLQAAWETVQRERRS